MKITKVKNAEIGDVMAAVLREFFGSRFTMEVFTPKLGEVSISKVRLEKSKEYCGNHMKACELADKNHRHSRYLEGADWVEFNDRVNDAMDRMGVDAKIASAKSSQGCIIRKGEKRRIRYDSNTRVGFSPQNYAWIVDYDAPEDHWKMCIGEEAPRSIFPKGTPGIYEALQYSVVG